MKTSKKSIGIVGGGLLGMTLALRLSERGFKVTLLEAAVRTGGLASSCKIGEYTWDRFYHVILMSDNNLLALLETLELKERINWHQTRTGFFTDGHLYSMSNIMDFFKFPPLNLLDKLRLGITIFYASKIRSWERLEAITVSDWLRHLSGSKTFRKIWLPLLKSKLGENYRLANAAFIWAIIARMYAARRSGLKQEMFGYVDGGYATILDGFQKHLDNLGVETLCHTAVKKLFSQNGGVRLNSNKDRSFEFDKVILTIPCTQIPPLCPQLSDSDKQRFNDVTYQAVLCASLILRKPLAGYYITNITDKWAPFTGVIEMTALVDKKYFGGNSLIYLPRYLDKEDPSWQKADPEIRNEFLAALESMYPSFIRDDVLASKISKATHVLPITTLNYSTELIPATTTSLQHVFVVNSAQIPNGTMNVNEIIGLANRKTDELTEILSAEPTERKAAVSFNLERSIPLTFNNLGSSSFERSAPLTYNDIDASNLKRSDPLTSNNSKPLASISLDLDNQWSYMKTHGDKGWEEFPSYFDVFIPKILDILAQLNLKITFFIVGQDAALDENKELLKLLTERGHEVGNHSFHHEPWLHLYPKDQLKRDILDAEDHIYRATGQKTVGFRGPGFAWSPMLFEVLAETGYLYDASILPTYLGPLGRMYYFWKSSLTKEEKTQRRKLYGTLREGLMPIKPFFWQLLNGERILEIPITTMPIFKIPFHLSYLLYLSSFSTLLMHVYLQTALALCLVTRTAPSFLLHPLDFLDGKQVPELAFFPGMDLNTSQKIGIFRKVVGMISKHFNVVNMSRHAKFGYQVVESIYQCNVKCEKPTR